MAELTTSYSPGDLALFVQQQLSDVARFLGWTDPTYPDGDFDEVINATLLSLGLTTSTALAAVTDIAKVRAVAMYHAWKQARAKAVLAVNYSADGVSVSRDQIMAHINQMLSDIEAEAAQYGVAPGYKAEVVPLDYPASPYGLRERGYYGH